MRNLKDVLANEDPKVVENSRLGAEEILFEIQLVKLREKLRFTQVELAKELGLSQPTISDMEKPGRDMRLSSLKRYVEGVGAKLRLNIEMPDGSTYGIAV